MQREVRVDGIEGGGGERVWLVVAHHPEVEVGQARPSVLVGGDYVLGEIRGDDGVAGLGEGRGIVAGAAAEFEDAARPGQAGARLVGEPAAVLVGTRFVNIDVRPQGALVGWGGVAHGGQTPGEGAVPTVGAGGGHDAGKSPGWRRWSIAQV